ncbi:conserved hypothetical protein [Ricinus communis]|uniref:Uncharacterized protein n=1 Tax=Ricinus communis TaxID=3988 RepID=B9TH77_RICCO|nr:conserved hypothetical protein [Ricinus communis]
MAALMAPMEVPTIQSGASWQFVLLRGLAAQQPGDANAGHRGHGQHRLDQPLARDKRANRQRVRHQRLQRAERGQRGQRLEAEAAAGAAVQQSAQPRLRQAHRVVDGAVHQRVRLQRLGGQRLGVDHLDAQQFAFTYQSLLVGRQRGRVFMFAHGLSLQQHVAVGLEFRHGGRQRQLAAADQRARVQNQADGDQQEHGGDDGQDDPADRRPRQVHNGDRGVDQREAAQQHGQCEHQHQLQQMVAHLGQLQRGQLQPVEHEGDRIAGHQTQRCDQPRRTWIVCLRHDSLLAADDDTDQQADAGRRGDRTPRIFLDVFVRVLRGFLGGGHGADLGFVGLGHRGVQRAHAAAAQFLGLFAGQRGGCGEQGLGVLDQRFHVIIYGTDVLFQHG